MTTPDTPESVRAVSEAMRQLVTGRAIDVAEDWRRFGPRMPVLDAHNMLTRYAALIEQVAAHNECCAGRWVKVEERLPGKDWVGDVCYEDGSQAFDVECSSSGNFFCARTGRIVPPPVWWREDHMPGER